MAQQDASVQLCLMALHLFCQAMPDLVVPHTEKLLPFLHQRAAAAPAAPAAEQSFVVYYAAKVLAETVPRLRAPSALFLKQLEERLVELILTGRAQTVRVGVGGPHARRTRG